MNWQDLEQSLETEHKENIMQFLKVWQKEKGFASLSEWEIVKASFAYALIQENAGNNSLGMPCGSL